MTDFSRDDGKETNKLETTFSDHFAMERSYYKSNSFSKWVSEWGGYFFFSSSYITRTLLLSAFIMNMTLGAFQNKAGIYYVICHVVQHYAAQYCISIHAYWLNNFLINNLKKVCLEILWVKNNYCNITYLMLIMYQKIKLVIFLHIYTNVKLKVVFFLCFFIIIKH